MEEKIILEQNYKTVDVPDGMKEVKIYITSDGKEFRHKNKAKEHEKKIEEEQLQALVIGCPFCNTIPHVSNFWGSPLVHPTCDCFYSGQEMDGGFAFDMWQNRPREVSAL